jgi:predicted pyridoxine 5'-phosphate oxidase superfamily flavin-nucleotide-binding protein
LTRIHAAIFSSSSSKAFDDYCRDFIARSPFVLIASSDGEGSIDISPKGDPPGLVQVLDDRTLAIPDRLGNHRADTFVNVVRHPFVGLIFLIPGTKNTLRVRGRATIVRDLTLRESMVLKGNSPSWRSWSS